MTQLKPQLSVNRLLVSHKGKTVYDEQFHAGVNIIRGSNSSGKSTIADFLFLALGGDLNKWKPEAEVCDFVMAEVNISGAPITIKRDVSTSPRQAMSIFFGPLSDALQSSVAGWQIYPFARVKGRESFSQVLFRALELPEVRGDGDSNITIHQLLRLIYIDQMSAVDSLMRNEGFDSPLTRSTVGDLLFGIYDDSLYGDELALRSKEKDLEAARQQLDSALEILGKSEIEIDFVTIQKAIAEVETKQKEIQARIDTLSKSSASSASTDANSLKAVEAKRKAVSQLRNQLTSLQSESEEQQLEVEDSRQFVMHLEERLAALDDSMVTRESLGSLKLSHCPQCLSQLQPPSSTKSCTLCKQESSIDLERSRVLRMKQELALQIKESRKLLSDKELRFSEILRGIPEIAEKSKAAQRSFDDAINRVRSPRDEELDRLLTERGLLEGRLESWHKQAKAISVLEALKKKCSKVTSEVEGLKIGIKQKRFQQESKKREAADKIEKYALALLAKDLPREELFRTAKHVAVDFEKNTFSIDGRNQFSASSIIYLKNCVHFGILFASLDLPFFRYPRFILCDNMEDKGMEQERSRNFQRVVVEMAKQFKADHQIIFTTSMIDPSLNNTPLCVGPEYSQQQKSLKFK